MSDDIKGGLTDGLRALLVFHLAPLLRGGFDAFSTVDLLIDDMRLHGWTPPGGAVGHEQRTGTETLEEAFTIGYRTARDEIAEAYESNRKLVRDVGNNSIVLRATADFYEELVGSVRSFEPRAVVARDKLAHLSPSEGAKADAHGQPAHGQLPEGAIVLGWACAEIGAKPHPYGVRDSRTEAEQPVWLRDALKERQTYKVIALPDGPAFKSELVTKPVHLTPVEGES